MTNYNNYPPYQSSYGYGYNNTYPRQQIDYSPQPIQQQPMNALPLVFVNGLIGAKSFVINQPNTTVYMRDSDSNMLYEKKANYEGRCTLKCYELKEVNMDEEGKIIKEEKPKNYVTKADIEELEAKINKAINDLSEAIKGAKVNE
jgi:hypothetical protein